MNPQWKHDCNRCQFYGVHLLKGDMVDVYACPDPRGTLPGGSVIVSPGLARRDAGRNRGIG